MLDFGMSRYVHFASRLTGWVRTTSPTNRSPTDPSQNAIKSRCEQLGKPMTDSQYKECTAKIKALGDVRKLAIEDTDSIIRTFHENLSAKEEKPLLKGMTEEEQRTFLEKQRELNSVEEKRELDRTADAEAAVPRAEKTATSAGA